MTHCLTCKNPVVLYKNPDSEKRRLVLSCCSNGGCATRKIPPASGADSFQAMAAFSLKFGSLS